MERYYYFKRTKRKSKKPIFTIFVFFSLLIGFVVLLRNILNTSVSSDLTASNTTSTNYPAPQVLSATSPPSPTHVISKQLEQTVQEALVGTHGSYGIVVKNLKTGEYYSLRENTTYEVASLYKLWVMATVYDQIKNGKLNPENVLVEDVKTLNEKFNIDPDLAEKTEGTIALTVTDALEQMITISDNYAALLLTEKIGLSSVDTFLKNNGFMQSATGSNGGAPTATPSNIALFFEKLYNLQLTNEKFSKEMLSLLQRQKLNNKIPKYLPSGLAIAHKTGELNEYTHDAGILYTNNGDYIIVLLSKSDDPDLAAERLANVSESVYNYFETQ